MLGVERKGVKVCEGGRGCVIYVTAEDDREKKHEARPTRPSQ